MISEELSEVSEEGEPGQWLFIIDYFIYQTLNGKYANSLSLWQAIAKSVSSSHVARKGTPVDAEESFSAFERMIDKVLTPP